MTTVDMVKKFIKATRGHTLNITVPEAQLLHDFAAFVDKQPKQSGIKHINFRYEKVGHIVILEDDVWARIVDFLQDHDLVVKEKAAQHSVHPTWCGRRV